MEKSPDAFRTISEVADELGLPQHVLRFWESKFPQLKPLKRGGGRRYYRPEDIGLLRRISDLLYTQGYTIKGVQKLLREHGVKHVVAAGRRVAAAARAAEPRAETPPAAPPAAPPVTAIAAAPVATQPAPRPVVAAVQPPPAAAPAPAAAPVTGDRIEMAARLFARLKALKRDYEQKLQAAKSGR